MEGRGWQQSKLDSKLIKEGPAEADWSTVKVDERSDFAGPKLLLGA